MQAKQFKDEYPIYTLSIAKTVTSMQSVDAIINTLRQKIEAHPVATYIGVFNHFEHTTSLSEGKISPQILDAKNLICCFGKEIPNPEVLAVRPRSFGIVEQKHDFVISFLKAPNPTANETMQMWVKSLQDL